MAKEQLTRTAAAQMGILKGRKPSDKPKQPRRSAFDKSFDSALDKDEDESSTESPENGVVGTEAPAAPGVEKTASALGERTQAKADADNQKASALARLARVFRRDGPRPREEGERASDSDKYYRDLAQTEVQAENSVTLTDKGNAMPSSLADSDSFAASDRSSSPEQGPHLEGSATSSAHSLTTEPEMGSVSHDAHQSIEMPAPAEGNAATAQEMPDAQAAAPEALMPATAESPLHASDASQADAPPTLDGNAPVELADSMPGRTAPEAGRDESGQEAKTLVESGASLEAQAGGSAPVPEHSEAGQEPVQTHTDATAGTATPAGETHVKEALSDAAHQADVSPVGTESSTHDGMPKNTHGSNPHVADKEPAHPDAHGHTALTPQGLHDHPAAHEHPAMHGHHGHAEGPKHLEGSEHATGHRALHGLVFHPHDPHHAVGSHILSDALKDHLTTHGMRADAASHTVGAITPHLKQVLDAHVPGSGEHLVFHPKGEVAVSIEHGHPAPAAQPTAVSLDTLHAVREQGMPQQGLKVLRDNLGPETQGQSNLNLVDSFGHDVVSALGREGYPREAVGQMKDVLRQELQGHGLEPTHVTDAHALSALGAVARGSEDYVQVLAQDAAGRDKIVTIPTEQLAQDLRNTSLGHGPSTSVADRFQNGRDREDDHHREMAA